jgi:hypothetical protein
VRGENKMVGEDVEGERKIERRKKSFRESSGEKGRREVILISWRLLQRARTRKECPI